MNHLEPVFMVLLAFLADLILGDPEYRAHPIRIMGRGISFLVRRLKGAGLIGYEGGIVLTLIIIAASVGAYLSVRFALTAVHPLAGLVLDLFVCYSCLAIKDLFRHVQPVIHFLEQNQLPQAREAVSRVVGRDVYCLDAAGVARAAVETLAENFVDGFLSPLFWFTAGALIAGPAGLSRTEAGLCLMVAFKAASTLDSMVGYKNEAFYRFGWAGARLDDLMNFIPARLSLAVLYAGARVTGMNAAAGLRTARRDRLKHESPNSAHAESFVAGALNIRLGGATVYPEGTKEKSWLGQGNPDPGSGEVRRTITLLYASAWIAVAVSMGGLVL